MGGTDAVGVTVVGATVVGATVVGVNARDLRTFEVDPELHVRLRKLVPRTFTYVARMGDARAEHQPGATAFPVLHDLGHGGTGHVIAINRRLD